MVLLPVQSRFSAVPTEGQEPGCPCSHPRCLRGRAKQARQNRGANCTVKTRRVKELGIKVWVPSFTTRVGKDLWSQQVWQRTDQLLLTENGHSCSTSWHLRDDYADEFACKDTLNFSKWICACFLFKLKLASASRVHTWNKTSSKVTAPEMQDTPPEPSLTGVL